MYCWCRGPKTCGGVYSALEACTARLEQPSLQMASRGLHACMGPPDATLAYLILALPLFLLHTRPPDPPTGKPRGRCPSTPPAPPRPASPRSPLRRPLRPHPPPRPHPPAPRPPRPRPLLPRPRAHHSPRCSLPPLPLQSHPRPQRRPHHLLALPCPDPAPRLPAPPSLPSTLRLRTPPIPRPSHLPPLLPRAPASPPLSTTPAPGKRAW